MRMRCVFSRGLFFQRLVLALSVLLAAPVSWAGQWRTTSGLSLNTTYTDNKDLSHNDQEGEVSLGITPSIGVTGEGGRLNMNARYAPSFRIRSSNDTSLDHNLAASGNAELYKDVLFLDASANARQALIDSNGRSGGDNVNNDNDTTQTFNYSISPYTLHHFGNYADSELRYRYSNVINNNSDTSNSGSHSVRYSLDSGTRFPVVPWSLSANYNHVNYDDGGNNSNTYHAEGDSSYVLSRIWSANFYGFYDKYDIQTDQSNDAGWGGGSGFTWTPSGRTSLRVAYGYRVLSGWNLYFDWSHRRKRSNWTASLTHDVQTSRDEQLSQRTFDDEGNPIFNPDAPDLRNNEFYTNDTLRTGYTLSGKRYSWGISAHATRREGQESGDKNDTYGASTTLGHPITPKTSSNLSLSWSSSNRDNNSERNADDDYDDAHNWTISAGLSHTLGPNTSLSFDLRHRKRISDRSEDEYDENRASLTLSMRWN